MFVGRWVEMQASSSLVLFVCVPLQVGAADNPRHALMALMAYSVQRYKHSCQRAVPSLQTLPWTVTAAFLN